MRLFPEQLAEHKAKGRTHEYDPVLQRFVSPNQITQRFIALKPVNGRLMFDHDRVEVWEAAHIHGVATTTSPQGRIQAGVTYQIRQFVNKIEDDRIQVNPPYIFAQPCGMGFDENRVYGNAARLEINEELGIDKEKMTEPVLIGKHVASNTFCQSWTPVYHAHAPYEATQNTRTDRTELIVFKEFRDIADIVHLIKEGSETREIGDGEGNTITATFNWGAALPNMSFMKWLMTNPDAWDQAKEGLV